MKNVRLIKCYMYIFVLLGINLKNNKYIKFCFIVWNLYIFNGRYIGMFVFDSIISVVKRNKF